MAGLQVEVTLGGDLIDLKGSGLVAILPAQ